MLHGRASVKSASHNAAPAAGPRMQTLTFSLKASELRANIVEKRCSAVDVVKHHLDLIKANETRLGSFIHVDEQGALAQACQLAC